MTKKSWFGALMGSDREEHHFIMAQDKPLSQVKADLVHAFLSVSICTVNRELKAQFYFSALNGLAFSS